VKSESDIDWSKFRRASFNCLGCSFIIGLLVVGVLFIL
jgi:hypothetical protein